MAEGVTTNSFRKRIAAQMSGGAVCPKIAKMAFGDGGHNADGTAKAANAEQLALNHELLRKDLLTVQQEDGYSVTGTGRLLKTELVGQTISEAGLLDASGNLVGLKNFAMKIKEEDEWYDVSIRVDF
ncbi:MAG: phage tail protein [Synergistaceae bacterium]|nr:phage tail protein [Synergistaceae bacterium]